MKHARSPRRTQTERRSASESALLDAAAALVARRGLARASLADIAEAAGASRSLPAHHFGSKDVLLARLAERAQRQLTAAMEGGVTEEERAAAAHDGLGLVRLSVSRYLDVFHNPDAYHRTLITMWGSMIPEDVTVPGIADAERRAVDGWAAAVRTGQEDGSIRGEVEPAATAALLLAMTRGVASVLLIDPGLIDLPRVRETCDAWIVAALSATS